MRMLQIINVGLFELRESLISFFARRRRHTTLTCDWSSDVCSSDLILTFKPCFLPRFSKKSLFVYCSSSISLKNLFLYLFSITDFSQNQLKFVTVITISFLVILNNSSKAFS